MTAAAPDPGWAACAAPPPSQAALVARIDASSPWLHLMAGPPDGGAWLRLDLLAEERGVARLCEAIRARSGSIGGVEAARAASGVAHLLSWLLLSGPVIGQRSPEPAASELWVGLAEEDQLLDRLAIAPTMRWAPAGPAQLDGRATAARLVGLLEPLVEGLAARRLLSRRALWGNVADAVAYQALEVLRGGGRCSEEGMALGEQLLSELPAGVRPPQWLTVWRGDREEAIRLKQACCLAYTSGTHGWCTTCPLTDETTRAARLEEWLAGESRAG